MILYYWELYSFCPYDTKKYRKRASQGQEDTDFNKNTPQKCLSISLKERFFFLLPVPVAHCPQNVKFTLPSDKSNQWGHRQR